MSSELIGVVGIVVLMLLLILRVPIGIALISVSFGGIWALLGSRSAWGILAVVPYDFVAQWTLSSVPMFLFMGFVAYYGGLTKGLFEAAKVWFARLPGGLAIASIFGSTAFASVSGSSVACAAAMGRIAIPEMLQRRYDPALATGAVAAGGTLGALIPPSILLIVYGVFTETPISKLFMAALGIGLLSAAGYILLIMVRVWLNPDLAPRGGGSEDEAESDLTPLQHLLAMWPVMALFAFVMGGLFLGFFTATEAGALGALAAILLAWVRGSLPWRALKQAVVETIGTTAGLFLIGIGANLLSRFMTLSGSDDLIAALILGVSADPYLLLLVIALIYLVIGMFLDPFGAMLLTLPVLLPVLAEADISTLWFGIFLLKLLEVGMLTPPIGLNVFVIKSVVGDQVSLQTIFKGVTWFIAVDLILITLMVFFPGLVTYLPSLGG